MPHLNKHDYWLSSCSLDEATQLVCKYHYAKGGPNTGVYRHGLQHRSRGLVGVAWWLPPTKVCAQSVDPDWRGVLSLTRLAIAPTEPTNAASYLLGRSMRLIRQDGRYHHLVTYADERMGHTGQIYRATNWEYVGLTKGDPVYVDSEGRQVSRKCAKVSRTHAEMLALGYICLGRSAKHKFVKDLRR